MIKFKDILNILKEDHSTLKGKDVNDNSLTVKLNKLAEKDLNEEKESTLSKIKKVNQQLANLAQRKIDAEDSGNPYVAHELVSHEQQKKQLLTKLKKLQSQANGEW